MTPKPGAPREPSTTRTASAIAFAAATSPLHVPPSELAILRRLLGPQKHHTPEVLSAALTSLGLSNADFHEAIATLCNPPDHPTIPTASILLTYSILRRLAFAGPRSPRRLTAVEEALWLVFHLTAGDTAPDTVSWRAWERLAAALGVAIGGIDSLPNDALADDLRARWARLSRFGFVRRGARGRELPLPAFVRLARADDIGLAESLRAAGFLWVHAVLDAPDATPDAARPFWDADADSCFLSQYVTHAILRTGFVRNERDAASSTGDRTSDADAPAPPAAEPPASVADERRVAFQVGHAPVPADGAGDTPLDIPDHDTLELPLDALADYSNTSPCSPEPGSSSGVSGLSTIRRSRHGGGVSPFHIDHSALQLGEKIGSGAYGDVFKGKFLMSPVAVKQFHVNVAASAGTAVRNANANDTADQDPSQFNRMMSISALKRFASVNTLSKYRNFVREVELMSVVRHPNLVLYMGACGDPNTPLCIVSELFEGGSLYEYLHDDPAFKPSVGAGVCFALNIARGMYYLHASQPSILHRDLKSRNVLLSGRKGDDGFPHVVICDFGLCQLFGEEVGASASSLGGGAGGTNAMGTAAYMSPGVINGEEYQAADDVYSYGILLHEIFTGDVLYKGLRAMQVMFGVVDGLRPSGTYDADVPMCIRNLISECWATERKERPPFNEIIERLTDIEVSLGNVSGLSN